MTQRQITLLQGYIDHLLTWHAPPTHAQLAERFALNVKTVRIEFKAMVQCGIITKHPTINGYTINGIKLTARLKRAGKALPNLPS